MRQRAAIAPARVVIALLPAIAINLVPATAMLGAEDAIRIQMPAPQTNHASGKGQILDGSQVVQPSPRERDAIYQLLAANPRPKTLKEADMKYLKRLLNKATWFRFEQKMVRDIWLEVNGKEWRDTEGPLHPKNEAFR
ncbi:MAG: hypothetical protein HOP32_09915 [Nitrospira sp.]|nr:hypothetical protein [Nitrospira sp.]